MTRERSQLAVSRLTVPLLVVLVAAVVVVSAVLAYETYRARRSLRVTAERALAQYAAMAGWELDAAVRARLEPALDQLFAPVLSGVAQSPYERSPDPAVLLPRAKALGMSCHESQPVAMRVDLGAGGLVTLAGVIDTAAVSAIQGAITQRLRSASAADTRFMVPFGDGGRLRFAAVGVRTARYGAPLAAYAVPDCGAVLLATGIRSALRNDALLPHDVRGTMPNDSLVALQVRDSSGAPLLDVTAAAMPLESVRQPLRAFPGAVAYLALLPASSVSLVAPPERSRLPLLIGLLGLCVALTLVALVQLRREHELARLRADFTSSVSHELRTPLAQILLFGETLSLQRARSEEERTLAATSIVREARRLMAMVDNILHFSQPRDVPEAAPEHLSLQPYIEDVVAGFAPLATAASMRVETRVAPGTVQADPGMLRQVILNLLDNAVKYGRAGQTIVVHAAPQNGATNGNGPRGVRLTVSDEGPGIAPSDRERIWSPYVRLTPNGQGRRAGSGIGLAVVRELVEAMHGRTWVEAAHPDGRGARFVVELPQLQANSQPPTPNP